MNFLVYCRELQFEDKPDYSYLTKLLKEILVEEDLENDNIYDWSEKPLYNENFNINFNKSFDNEKIISIRDENIKKEKEKEKDKNVENVNCDSRGIWGKNFEENNLIKDISNFSIRDNEAKDVVIDSNMKDWKMKSAERKISDKIIRSNTFSIRDNDEAKDVIIDSNMKDWNIKSAERKISDKSLRSSNFSIRDNDDRDVIMDSNRKDWNMKNSERKISDKSLKSNGIDSNMKDWNMQSAERKISDKSLKSSNFIGSNETNIQEYGNF